MQQPSVAKNIILGISGSIAAYKSIDLAKSLIEGGFNIKILLSATAPEFISVLTLRSLFPEKVYLSQDTLGHRDEMLHITLAKSADLILIAPCSAHMMAKIADGFADCLLSTVCLATAAPIALAPAMNKVMWENKRVQSHVETLQSNGVYMIGPAVGPQACGDHGLGRMVDP